MRQLLYKAVFLFVLLCTGQAHALTSGTTTTGSITTPGGTSSQSFTATAGEGVMLYAYSSDYTAHIAVYKPDGTYWGAGTQRLSGTLPATGTYNVVISAASPSATGSYSISYVQGGGGVSNGSLTSGQSYNGTLALNGLESFQFTGTSGEGVMLYADASYAAYINVYEPDGSIWGTGNRRFDGTLPATGTYTVVIYASVASSSGSYRLDYARGGDDVSNGSLASGQSYDGTLAVNGLESFQFTGTAGQGVLLFAEASYASYINVYKPDGSIWGTGNRRFIDTLPSTGTYTVIVYASGYTNSGPYRLDYFLAGDNVSYGTLVSGSQRTGNLLANGIETYKFSAVSGGSLGSGLIN